MPIVTPNVEADLITRLVVLAPTVFRTASRRNIFEGVEQRPDGVTPVECAFVRFYAERQVLYYGGQRRELLCQVLARHAPDGWTPKRRNEAMTRLRTVYDAVHMSGTFTAGGTTYDDIRAVDAPNELENAYFAMNLAVWHRS